MMLKVGIEIKAFLVLVCTLGLRFTKGWSFLGAFILLR